MPARTRVEPTSAITPVQAKENSPPWFSWTLIMLQSELAMGEKWMELVTVWASFEAWLKFKEIKKLAPINCPLQWESG